MKKKTGATPLVPVGGTKDSPLYSRLVLRWTFSPGYFTRDKRLYNQDYRGFQPGVKPLSPPVNSNTRAIEGCGVILDYRQHERYAREDTYERGDTKLTVRGERIPYGRGDKVDGDIDLAGTEEVEKKPTKPPQSAQLAQTWNPYGPKSPIQVSSRNLLNTRQKVTTLSAHSGRGEVGPSEHRPQRHNHGVDTGRSRPGTTS
uniref:Uncharacterized protein n=1 Tax=Oryza barthii TaxID=65489 RepID=A0A0D3GZE3_9ORYZ